MTDYKLVPLEPTPEMVSAAEDAYMPFGDMELALRMAILAAPAAQGEPVVSAGWAADAIRDAHLEGQRSATGRYHSLFRWNNSESHAVFLRLLSRSQPAEQNPECGCCGQTDRCDDDCDAVVIGRHRAAEQQPAPDVAELVEALEAIAAGEREVWRGDHYEVENDSTIDYPGIAKEALDAHRKGAQP